jgi:hypothetical protein
MEVALLEATEAAADGPDDLVPTEAVLDRAGSAGFGPSYAVRVLQDLGVPWRTHLRPFELDGNWGSVGGDPMADPCYTKVRLSAVGRLALAAERGEVGPVPVDLVNGSAYRGGRVPPLHPERTLALLADLVAGGRVSEADLAGLVDLPTGGVVGGDLDALVAGRPARVRLGCRIEREPGALVITGTPLGVDVDRIHDSLRGRVQVRRSRPFRGYADYLEHSPDRAPGDLLDVADRTARGRGTRVVVSLADGADVDAAETWVRSVWPVTVEVDWQVPGGIAGLLGTWAERCRQEPSGLTRLAAAL